MVPRRSWDSAETALLSPAQHRILTAEGAVWRGPLAARLHGPLDFDALVRTLGALVERHEILRTRFPRTTAGMAQVVARPAPVPLELEDLSEYPAKQWERLWRDWLTEQPRARFDLETGPLLRPTVLRLDDKNHILRIAVHPAVLDDRSATVLLRELATLYGDLRGLKPLSLPPLAVQYRDFAMWHREKVELSGTRLRARPGSATLCREVETDVVSGLEALADHEGTSLFVTLLTAYRVALARCWPDTADHTVEVARPISNRPELRPLIGPLTEHVAVDTGPPVGLSFLEALGETATAVTEVTGDRDSPQFHFDFVDAAPVDLEFGSLRLVQVVPDEVPAQSQAVFHPSSLSVSRAPGSGLRVRLTCTPEAGPSGRELLNSLDEILRQAAQLCVEESI